jgi:uncharacterized protein with FMN-binding domain
MKRAILAAASTVASLVLLLSFKTHGPSAVATPPAAVSNGTNSGGNDTSSATTTKNKAKAKKSTTTSRAASTYTGSAADTRYGPVRVRVTVANGKVTNAEAVVYPTSAALDQQINSYAIPQLNSEATSASSANIDMISGATFTSQGYIASLQSALDQAGL